MWQEKKGNYEWLPFVVPNPLPFAAAVWARTVEISSMATFVALVLTTATLFEEIVNSAAEDLQEDLGSVCSGAHAQIKLDLCRRHYDLVCRLIKKINQCFGPILLIEISIAFSLPMFEFYSIWRTLGAVPTYNFSFIHTTLRFLIWILVPSYILTQQVSNLIFFSKKL